MASVDGQLASIQAQLQAARAEGARDHLPRVAQAAPEGSEALAAGAGGGAFGTKSGVESGGDAASAVEAARYEEEGRGEEEQKGEEEEQEEGASNVIMHHVKTWEEENISRVPQIPFIASALPPVIIYLLPLRSWACGC